MYIVLHTFEGMAIACDTTETALIN